MKKRILCLGIVTLLLVACFMILSAMTATAGTSNNVIAGRNVTTTCNLHSSSHSITGGGSGSYPSGSGRIYYTQNGVLGSKAASGVSYSSYWSGSTSLTASQNAYKAVTTYKGEDVTAVYP